MQSTPVAVVIAGLAAGGALAKDKPKPPVPATVNCGAGGSVNASLAAGATLITVVGTCTENVVIELDSVTLQGDPNSFGTIEPADPAQPVIFVRRATGVTLQDLTLDASAGQYGLWLSNADAIATNLAIETATTGNFANYGAIAFSNSQLQVFDSVIGPSDVGLAATDGGAAEIIDSAIVGNANVGVMAARGSSIDIRTSVGGNVVQTNGDGVWAIDNGVARLRSGTEVSGNSGDGVRGIRGGVLNIDNADITGNGGDGVDLYAESTVRINGGSVTGNSHNGIRLVASTADIVNGSLDNNGNHGAHAQSNSHVSMVDATASNNGNRGVYAIFSSAIFLSGVTVDANGNRGVVVANSSAGTLRDSTITNNTDRGVWAWDNSSVELTGGNSITGNGSYGVRAQNGSVAHIYNDNTLTGNLLDDLSAYQESHVEVSSFATTPGLATTIGAVGVSSGSNVTMSSGTAVSVSIGTGSTGLFEAYSSGGPVNVTGNVECWTNGVSAAFASDAIAESPGPLTDALDLDGTTNCATLTAQGF